MYMFSVYCWVLTLMNTTTANNTIEMHFVAGSQSIISACVINWLPENTWIELILLCFFMYPNFGHTQTRCTDSPRNRCANMWPSGHWSPNWSRGLLTINLAPCNELVKSCLRLLCSAQDVKIFFYLSVYIIHAYNNSR